jgi:preprotein translocase subunit SecA
VHVVTVSDYLARRDWNGWADFTASWGCRSASFSTMNDQERQVPTRRHYHGTNNEFGFDYLRDNMKFDLALRAARAPLRDRDEVDSIRSTRRGRRSSSPAQPRVNGSYYEVDHHSASLAGAVTQGNVKAGPRGARKTGDYLVDESTRQSH